MHGRCRCGARCHAALAMRPAPAHAGGNSRHAAGDGGLWQPLAHTNGAVAMAWYAVRRADGRALRDARAQTRPRDAIGLAAPRRSNLRAVPRMRTPRPTRPALTARLNPMRRVLWPHTLPGLLNEGNGPELDWGQASSAWQRDSRTGSRRHSSHRAPVHAPVPSRVTYACPFIATVGTEGPGNSLQPSVSAVLTRALSGLNCTRVATARRGASDGFGGRAPAPP